MSDIDHVAEANPHDWTARTDDGSMVTHALLAIEVQLRRIADAVEDANHRNCRHHNGFNCGSCVPEANP